MPCERTIIDPNIQSLNDLSRTGAAALQSKYGGQMRLDLIQIAPEYLSDDEMEYEFLVRGMFLLPQEARDRTRTLRTKLVAEQRGAQVPTKSPFDHQSDVFVIKRKLSEVAQILQTKELGNHVYNNVVSTLAHLEQRIARLNDETETTRSDRNELEVQIEYLIRCIVDYTKERGARPKPGPGPFEFPPPPEANAIETVGNDPQPMLDLDNVFSFQRNDAVPVRNNVGPNAGPNEPIEVGGTGRRTFDNVLDILGANPGAQSTRWSNRDSTGTTNTANSRNVQFDLGENTPHNLVPHGTRRDTPYSRRNDFQFVNGSGVGDPNDFLRPPNVLPTASVAERTARGLAIDHQAIMRRPELNGNRILSPNVNDGGRTYDIGTSLPEQHSATSHSDFNGTGENNVNRVNPFEQSNGAGPFERLNANRNDPFTPQPVRTNFVNRDTATSSNNIFGILSPNRNTTTSTIDGQWGRNASVFGQFSRTKAVPVHTWGFTFSGEPKKKTDSDVGVNEFIYRVNVNKRMQGLSDADILSQIGFLLTHGASTWYLACQHMFTSWQTFIDAMRRTFLSSYHMIDAMDEISRRVQGKNESARSFLYHMVMLFRTLPYGVEEHIQTHIIIRNLLPEVQVSVGPWRPNTIAGLEEILAAMQPRSFHPIEVEKKPPFRRTFVRKTNTVAEIRDLDDESVFEITEEVIVCFEARARSQENQTHHDGESNVYFQ